MKFWLLVMLALACSMPAFAKLNDVTLWKVSFTGVMPNNDAKVDKAYCDAHSPNQFTATVKALMDDGVLANNKVMVKFASYYPREHQGLHFIDVNGRLTGEYKGKDWQQKLYMHSQKLKLGGRTEGVWSTSECKGFYVAQVKGHKSVKEKS